MEQSKTIAEVVSITPIGIGSRVCIDMIDQLGPLEGTYVGNTGHGYVKVLSENRETDTYPARPFRINLGALHQYIMQDNGKTIYLSEIKPGMKVPIYFQNQLREVAIGRVKIEKRKFLRIVCATENGVTISTTLQESDSVHVETKDCKEKAVVDLKQGDYIVCVEDEPGRHLGEKINEEIEER